MSKIAKASSRKTRTKSPSAGASFFSERLQAALLFVFVCILYAQTLSFDYVLDDRMAMTENSVVQQGLAGIPTLLTKDSFFGYDESHGRTETRRTYRPLSFISFAIEKQVFGNNPRASHTLNVLLYATTVVIVFLLLSRLLVGSSLPRALPMMAALLFAAHPIHTEVVSNVKSRDEILALLFAALSLLVLWYYRSSGKLLHWAASCLLFVFALLAKESMLPFVVVIPLALYFFSNTGIKQQSGLESNALSPQEITRLSVPYFVLALIYALVWFGLVGRVEEALYTNILGNPFTGASLGERLATASAVMIVYFSKAFYPTTLSIGYSYNQIPLQSWSSGQALLGAALILGLLSIALFYAGKKHLLSFCVLFFVLMMSVTSNFFVYAGGLLGERFLFAPSLAVVLGIAYLLVFAAEKLAQQQKNLANASRIAWVAAFFIVTLYAVQTLTRTADWRSDYTLLKADVVSTPQSFNMQQGYAKELLRRAGVEQNPLLRKNATDSAFIHLQRALAVYPEGEAETFSTLASAFDLVQRYDSAAFYAAKAVQMSPRSAMYQKNLAIIHSNKGVDFAQAGNFQEAVACFLRAFPLDSSNASLCGNIGGAFAAMHQRDSAMKYLQRAVTLDPMNAMARANLERIRAEGSQ